MSDSLWPKGLQHARLPCPSLFPGVCLNSRLLSRWCHPAVSSSVIPFSSYLQSFPASRSFPVSQPFALGSQSIGVSTSILPISVVLVALLCPILCKPMDCSPLGSSVHGILQAKILEWVAIPFTSNSSQPGDWTQVFCIASRFFTIWATRKVSSNEYSGLISFRVDFFDLLVVQGALKTLLQHHGWKASVLWCSAFFIVQLSYPYMTTGKTIALTIWIFISKVMSLLFKMLSRFVIAFLPRRKHLSGFNVVLSKGFPRWCRGEESTCQCRRHKRLRFHPSVRRILWRRKWQLTPIFLPGKSYELRNLVGCSPWGCKRGSYNWASKHKLIIKLLL